jgi:hypothetical protein
MWCCGSKRNWKKIVTRGFIIFAFCLLLLGWLNLGSSGSGKQILENLMERGHLGGSEMK